MKKQLLFSLALFSFVLFSSCETKCDVAKDIDELRAEKTKLQQETSSLSSAKDQINSQITKLNDKVKELKIYESGNVPHYYMRLHFTPTTLRIRNVVVNSFSIEIPVDKRFYESNDVGASCGRMRIDSKWITKQRPVDIQILGDRIGKHFRHPIYCHMYARDVFSVGEMIKLPDNELKSIRNFGVVAIKKVNDIRELVKKANGSIDMPVNCEK